MGPAREDGPAPPARAAPHGRPGAGYFLPPPRICPSTSPRPPPGAGPEAAPAEPGAAPGPGRRRPRALVRRPLREDRQQHRDQQLDDPGDGGRGDAGLLRDRVGHRLAHLGEDAGHQPAAEQPAAERGHALERRFGHLRDGLADLVAVVVVGLDLLLEVTGHRADRGRDRVARAGGVGAEEARDLGEPVVVELMEHVVLERGFAHA